MSTSWIIPPHHGTQDAAPLPIVTVADAPYQLVESIQAVQDEGQQRSYRIRWVGLQPHQDSWIPLPVLLLRPGTRTQLEHLTHTRSPTVCRVEYYVALIPDNPSA